MLAMERNSPASAPGVTQEATRNLSLNMTTPLEIDGAVVTEVVGVSHFFFHMMSYFVAAEDMQAYSHS